MRIVLSGYYGFDNVGDEAILYAIIQSLKEYYPEIGIVVLSNKPEKTARTYGVEAVNRWNVAEVAKAIKAADGLISGGGSLLQDETGRKSIPYYAGVMKIAQFLKKAGLCVCTRHGAGGKPDQPDDHEKYAAGSGAFDGAG
nr:polysaccharide pyruvyl transferase family protein [Planococcus glaciei]